MPEDQGAVWFAFEADSWVRRKLALIGRAEPDSANFQYFVSTVENVTGHHSPSGLTGAVTSARSLSWLQASDCWAVDSTSIRLRAKGSGMPASTPLTHASMCCRAKGGPKRRLWRKIHIGIDEQTLEIRAV